MKTQFITDNSGQKLAVILPIKDYNRMIEELEDLEDVKLYDKVKAVCFYKAIKKPRTFYSD